MALGPEIGDAYIEIHADTRGLPGEIRRAAKQAGADFGGEFANGLNSQLDQQMSVVGRRFRKSLTADGKLAGRDFGEAIADEVRHSFDRLDRDLARAVATGDWKDAFANFDMGNLDEAVDHAKARLEELKRTSDSFGDSDFQAAASSMDEYADSIREATKNADAHRRSLASLNQELYDQQKRTTEINVQQERLVDLAHEMNKAFDSDALRKRTEAMDHWKGLLRQTEEVERDHATLLKRQVDLDHEDAQALNRRRGSLRRLVTSMRDYNDEISIFGRLAGSRNNFLNIIGITLRGVERAVGRTVDKLGEIPEKFAEFASSVQQNGGGLSGFAQSIGQAFQGDWVTVLAKAGLVIFSVTQMLPVTISLFGVLTSALSGLAAIATALVGVIGMGLIGGLAALAPIAVAAAAGLGAVIIAVSNSGDSLSKALTPLKDWAKTVGEMVSKNLFGSLADQIEGMKGVLNDFVGPLLMNSATALRETIDHMVAAFQNEDVKNTLQILGQYLPQILGDLGGALVGFATGFLGFLAAASPIAANFANLLQSWGENFTAFTNSPAGQTRLQDFLQVAYDAFLSIVDLVGSLTGALLTLFEQVSPTGQEFLDKITGIVDKFNEWAQSDEGRAQIATWMQYAKDLADSLWESIQAVGRMIDALDSPENRQALLSLIDAFTQLINFVTTIARHLAPLGEAFANVFRAAGSAFSWASDRVEDLFGWVKKAKDALSSFTSGGWAGTLLNLANAAKGVVGKAANGRVVNGPTTLLTGEAGPEAIVPLNRPLSMVDPSVRALSAIAQGKTPAMGSGGISGGGVVIESGAFQVFTPARDPGLVASMVMDRFVARAN